MLASSHWQNRKIKKVFVAADVCCAHIIDMHFSSMPFFVCLEFASWENVLRSTHEVPVKVLIPLLVMVNGLIKKKKIESESESEKARDL